MIYGNIQIWIASNMNFFNGSNQGLNQTDELTAVMNNEFLEIRDFSMTTPVSLEEEELATVIRVFVNGIRQQELRVDALRTEYSLEVRGLHVSRDVDRLVLAFVDDAHGGVAREVLLRVS